VTKSIRKVKIVEKLGRKIYRLKPVDGKGDLGRAGWLQFENSNTNYFYHHCEDLNAKGSDVYYVWRPRIYDPPEQPVACPRCRYRMDYVPVKERRDIM